MSRLVRFVSLLILICSTAVSRAGSGGILPWRNARIQIGTTQSDSGSCTIPFNRVGNLIVIKAKVDSLEGNFVLDTGAPYLVLNITYFRDYPVTVASDAEQSSITGQAAMQHKTSVGELSFGLLNFFRTDADLVNLGAIENAKGIKVLGLLGVELFKQCELLIDFEKNEIHLLRIIKKTTPACGHNYLSDTSTYRTYPIELMNNRIVATTEIAGKKLKLAIDCAAESNILDSRLPDKIFELVTVTRRVKLSGASDRKVDALYGNLSKMKMGKDDIDNLPVVVLNLEYTCFADGTCLNGVLGFEFLSRHRIGFNFVTNKMYIWK